MKSNFCVYHLGFVGVRQLDSHDCRTAPVLDSLRVILSQASDGVHAEVSSIVGVSSLAKGADLLFAECLTKQAIAHRVLLPVQPEVFFNLDDFGAELPQAKAQLVTSNIIERRVVSAAVDAEERFAECSFEIVNQSDILIAICDSAAEVRRGGTREAIDYALTMGKPVIEIRVNELEDGRPKMVYSNLPKNLRDFFSANTKGHHGGILKAEEGAYAIEALMKHHDAEALRHQSRFLWAASAGIVLHLIASFAAAYKLAMDCHWLGLTVIKMSLIGVGIAISWAVHRWHVGGHWAQGRFKAEVCRALISIRGLPESPAHLRLLVMPVDKQELNALEACHLEDVKKNPISIRDFRERYVRGRLDDQADYYTRRCAEALGRRRACYIGFYFTSFTAIGLMAVYWWNHLHTGHGGHELPPSDLENFVANFAWKFLPFVLPVVSAGFLSWSGMQHYDRNIARYGEMAELLRQATVRIKNLNSWGLMGKEVCHVELAILSEQLEWYHRQVHTHAH